ncbi:MAG TPA: enoyl-CoA hydratase-related protein [Spirochaetia bacterium]|nr:enoyl-CoA hydratase-related protein [Spirochaetia bacterium]
MDYQNISLEMDGDLALLTINRPQVRNALDPPTWAEIRAAVRQCRNDYTVRVLIITGAGGKAFASGADIRSLRDRQALDVLKSETQETLSDIEALDKVVIAAIDGYALGGGCELAMACDIRIATDRSKLGQPEVNLGIIPGAGGTQRLQRLVGLGKAKELIFTGDIIDAAEAERIGLVNKVVGAGELLPAAKEMAAKIAAKGPVAVSLAKASIAVGADTDIRTGLLFEKMAQTVAFFTGDRLEGTSAFLEKRKPDFQGE